MPHVGGRRLALPLLLGAVIAWSAAPPFVAAATGAGWLDPGFGDGGFTAVPHSTIARSRCGGTKGIARAATGRIFVAAIYCGADPNVTPSEVVAFTASGRIDRAFHAGRPLVVVVGDGAGLPTLGRAFATPTGGLIAHRMDNPGSCESFRRFSASGRPDTTYGRSCLPVPDFFVGGAATLLPGGSMRACIHQDFDPLPVALTGLTPAGGLDQRIGPDGYRLIDFDCAVFTSDAQGRLYWIARRWLPEGRAVIDVRRTTHAGAIDTSWGTGGVASIELAGQHLKPVEVVPAADGSLLVGVAISDSPTNASWRAGVARLTQAGVIDVAFGDAGVRRYIPPRTNASRLEALTVDPAGRPIVSVSVPTGRPYPEPYSTGYLTRGRASDGAPDDTFGIDGWVTLSRPVVDLAMGGPSRILLVSEVRDGLILSARRN